MLLNFITQTLLYRVQLLPVFFLPIYFDISLKIFFDDDHDNNENNDTTTMKSELNRVRKEDFRFN